MIESARTASATAQMTPLRNRCASRSGVLTAGLLIAQRLYHRIVRGLNDSVRGHRLRPEAHRQRLQLVDERRLGVYRLAVHRHLGVALERLLEQRPQLEPRERGPPAEVPAPGTKRLMLGGPGHVEPVGILVTRVLAVRGHVPQHDLLALPDRLSRELRVA